jgi:hypothetical protein
MESSQQQQSFPLQLQPLPQQEAQAAEHSPVPLQHPQQVCSADSLPSLTIEEVAPQQQQVQSSCTTFFCEGPQQQSPLQQDEQQQLQHPADPQQEAHIGEQIPVPLQQLQQACSSVNKPALAIPGEAAQQQHMQSSASNSLFTKQS